MFRITTLLSVATHRMVAASIYPRASAAPAISITHSAAGALIVAVLLGVGVVVLMSRVNSVLIDLVSQLVQVAAAVGRMLILILVLIVIGTLILLHV
jgi:hypothetical protein